MLERRVFIRFAKKKKANKPLDVSDLKSLTRLVFDADVYFFEHHTALGDNLKEIVFNDGLREIYMAAFYATGIRHIKFPDNVELSHEVLSNCQKLKSVSFPKGMSVVNRGMCENDINLESVEFNSDVFRFKESCFRGCKKLNLKLLDTLTGIGPYALAECGNTEIVVPKSWKISIQKRVFVLIIRFRKWPLFTRCATAWLH